MTPSLVQSLVKSGNSSNYFAVGDLLSIRLSGTVGICDVTGDWYCSILGFDHNKELEGDNTVHFQFPYTADGTGLAFYAQRIVNEDIGFQMNLSNITSGGWTGSYMCKTIIPQLVNTISNVWKSIISILSKWRNNKGSGFNTAECITRCSSKMHLLSEFEVHGTRYYANEYEQNYQKQYNYYKNGGSKLRRIHNRDVPAIWWLSSSSIYGGGENFCDIYENGNVDGFSATSSLSISSIFAIA